MPSRSGSQLDNLSDYMSSEVMYEEVSPTRGDEPAPGQEREAHVLPSGDPQDLHLGDYVSFERINAEKGWTVGLGRVVGVSTSRYVKIAIYDPVPESHQRWSDEAIAAKAEAEGNLELLEKKQQLTAELQTTVAAESGLSTKFFNARSVMLSRQSEVSAQTERAMTVLDRARESLAKVPQRQWRDLRSAAKPDEALVTLVRGVMMVMREDKAESWGDMQRILKAADFTDRMMALDCAVTPIPESRRRRVEECLKAKNPVSRGATQVSSYGGSQRGQSQRGGSQRGGSQRGGSVTGSVSGGSTYHRKGSAAPSGPVDIQTALNEWIRAQLLCSECREQQEAIVDQCFAEQQEQRVMLREINEMRMQISTLHEMVRETNNAITGDTSKAVKTGDGAASTYLKRYIPGEEFRFVQEIVLRSSFLTNHGPIVEENSDGYAQLDEEQMAALNLAIKDAQHRHELLKNDGLTDEQQRHLDRMVAELADVEQEIAELQARIAELRNKQELTPEEADELAQLERLLANAEARRAHLKESINDIETARYGAQPLVKSELHLKFSGDDWYKLLKDDAHRACLTNAFVNGVSKATNLPAERFSNVRFTLGSLIIDFTVEHSPDMDAEELQALVEMGEFAELCQYYEKVTFKKTSLVPSSTAEMDAFYYFASKDCRDMFHFAGLVRCEDVAACESALRKFEAGFDPSDEAFKSNTMVYLAKARNDFTLYALYGPRLCVVEEATAHALGESYYARATAGSARGTELGTEAEDEEVLEEEMVAASAPNHEAEEVQADEVQGREAIVVEEHVVSDELEGRAVIECEELQQAAEVTPTAEPAVEEAQATAAAEEPAHEVMELEMSAGPADEDELCQEPRSHRSTSHHSNDSHKRSHQSDNDEAHREL